MNTKTLSAVAAAVLALLVAAFALNPSADRHREVVKATVAERSPIAGALGRPEPLSAPSGGREQTRARGQLHLSLRSPCITNTMPKAPTDSTRPLTSVVEATP